MCSQPSTRRSTQVVCEPHAVAWVMSSGVYGTIKPSACSESLTARFFHCSPSGVGGMLATSARVHSFQLKPLLTIFSSRFHTPMGMSISPSRLSGCGWTCEWCTTTPNSPSLWSSSHVRSSAPNDWIWVLSASLSNLSSMAFSSTACLAASCSVAVMWTDIGRADAQRSRLCLSQNGYTYGRYLNTIAIRIASDGVIDRLNY